MWDLTLITCTCTSESIDSNQNDHNNLAFFVYCNCTYIPNKCGQHGILSVCIKLCKYMPTDSREVLGLLTLNCPHNASSAFP